MRIFNPLQHHRWTAWSLRSGWLALALFGLALAGCAQTGSMADQPRYDTYEASELFPDGSSARVPPAGAVAYSVENAPGDPAATGLDPSGQPLASIPLEINQELVARGQERYGIFCVPCHGPTGEGNGRATQYGMPAPPSLLGEEAKALPAGTIFDVITHGKGVMFPYGYRVKAPDRWAIIAYIRAMQIKNGAVQLEELTQDDFNQIGGQP